MMSTANNLNRPKKLRKIQAPVLEKIYTDYTETRVFYDCLQFKNPGFVGHKDADGDSFYTVNHTDKVKREGHLYHAVPYSIVLPTLGEDQQSITLALDNIELIPQTILELAKGDIELIYRVYVEGSDAVQLPPLHLKVISAGIENGKVQIEAARPDLFARKFPNGERYDRRFGGLFV